MKTSVLVMLMALTTLAGAWLSLSQRTEGLWDAGCQCMPTVVEQFVCSGPD